MFKLLNYLTLATLLLSCLSPRQDKETIESISPQTEKAKQATFFVNSIKADSSISRVNPTWGKVESVKYTFHVCLKDIKTRKDVIGHTFSIQDKSSSYSAQTDDNGCMFWSEDIAFNAYAQPQLIINERTISSSGVHRGSQEIKFAINPWAVSSLGGTKTEEFIDLEHNDVTESFVAQNSSQNQVLSGRSKSGEIEEVPLWTKSLSMKIDNSVALADGVELTFTLKFDPYLTLTDIAGQQYTSSLNNGYLKVFVNIYSSITDTTGKEIKTLLTSYTPTEYTEFMKGEFSQIFSTKIGTYATSGKLEAAIRIIPSPSLSGVKSFEGIFALNEPTKMIGSHSGVLMSGKNTIDNASFNLEENYQDITRKTIDDDSEIRNLQPYEMGTMDISFDSIEKGTESATKRTILYRIKSCVTRTLDGAKVNYQRFKITLEDGQEIVTRTDPTGCLLWNDKITHKYYKPEQLVPKKFIIEHINSGSKYEKIAYLNPWDFGWTFGRDKSELTDQYLDEMKKAPLVTSKLFLDRFQYQMLRFRYDVDEYLNMKVKKAVLLTAAPNVLRYSSIVKGRRMTEWLRDGIYLLKVAIQKDYQDKTETGVEVTTDEDAPYRLKITNRPSTKNIEYLTIVKKLVRVQYGEIITPLEFSMEDLRLMRIRSNFLIQIQTIDEELLGISNDMKLEDIAPEKVQRVLTDLAKKRLTQTIADENLGESQETIDTLIANDQRIQEIATQLDLDDLIETDSGLESRTFIGPVTLISNSFSSGLRPTDDLQEVLCENIDCNAINEDGTPIYSGGAIFNSTDSDAEAAGQAELQKFYGDVGHFKDVTVTDLIERLPEIAKKKENENKFRSLLSSYLYEYQLNYVSLEDHPLKVIKDYDQDRGQGYCVGKNVDKCIIDSYQNTIEKNEILKYLNFSEEWYRKQMEGNPYDGLPADEMKYTIYGMNIGLPKIGKPELKEFIKTGAIDENMVNRLCFLWSYYMLDHRVNAVEQATDNRTLKHIFSGDPDMQRDRIFYDCVMEGSEKISNVFDIYRHLKAYDTGTFYFEGGKSLNLNIGANSSLGHGESTSRSVSFAVDPLKYLSHIPGKIFSAANKILDGVKYSMGVGWSNSESWGEGTSVTAQTYLAMQQVRIDLNFNEMERCISIKMNKDFLEKINFMKKYAALDFTTKADIMTKGLFICTGQREQSDRPYPEHYYYFTQHFTMGDMQDKGDIKNHPWLLALRGEYDYLKFVNMLDARTTLSEDSDDFGIVDMAQYATTGWWVEDPEKLEKAKQEFELGSLPLDQLINVYNNVIPSFPGIYTIRPDKLDYPKGTN